MIDLWLAIAHHVLAFGLVAMLATELAMVRPGMSSVDALRAARIDAGYGASAGLIIAAGLLRIYFGAKGVDYYLFNVWFWAKLAAFAAMGIASVAPTIRFIAWRNAARKHPGFVPPPGDIGRVRMFLGMETALLGAILTLAATMARYTDY